MDNCIFCKIIKGEIPSKDVYEDEIVKVFLDVNPVANGHMLVVPKKHVTDFTELDDETAKHLNQIAKRMLNGLNATLKPQGVRLCVNYGMYQEVKHYHLHIIPGYEPEQPIKDINEVYEEMSK